MYQERELPEPREIEAMSAEEILVWAFTEFGDRLGMTCAWQRQASVLVHMAWSLSLPIPVIELDTGLLFQETHETRERLRERYGFELRRPATLSLAAQHRQEGANLWERDPDRCCQLRKVEPLARALAPFDAWISGVRRDQSAARAAAEKLEWSDRFEVFKIQPLADWDRRRVDAYIAVHEIPVNPLHEQGYPSIGCIPCTRPVGPGEDERAGRWSGQGKLECGLHTPPA